MRIAQRNTGPPRRFRTVWAGLIAALCLIAGPGFVPASATATPSPGGQKIALVVRPSYGMVDPMRVFADAVAHPGRVHRARRSPASRDLVAHADTGSPASRAGGRPVVHLW